MQISPQMSNNSFKELKNRFTAHGSRDDGSDRPYNRSPREVKKSDCELVVSYDSDQCFHVLATEGLKK